MKINKLADSVDPNEEAGNEPQHLALPFLPGSR